MDIIITGGQGVGKTSAAQEKIAAHFGAKSIYNVSINQLLIVSPYMAERVDVLRETIRAARVEAVLIEEIKSDAALLIAIQAVKEARVTMGRNLYAVYVQQVDGPLAIAEYSDNYNLNQNENRN